MKLLTFALGGLVFSAAALAQTGLRERVEGILAEPLEVLSQRNQDISHLLGFEYLASSSWKHGHPTRGFSNAQVADMKNEAEAAYQRLLVGTPSLRSVSETIDFETSKLCTKLKVVNVSETNIEESEEYHIAESQAEKFIGNLVSLFSKSSYSESYKSEYKYYQVTREVKCVKEVPLMKAVIRVTPDLLTLDNQLIAKEIYRNYEKNKAQFLSDLELAFEKLNLFAGSPGASWDSGHHLSFRPALFKGFTAEVFSGSCQKIESGKTYVCDGKVKRYLKALEDSVKLHGALYTNSSDIEFLLRKIKGSLATILATHRAKKYVLSPVEQFGRLTQIDFNIESRIVTLENSINRLLTK